MANLQFFCSISKELDNYSTVKILCNYLIKKYKQNDKNYAFHKIEFNINNKFIKKI